MEWWYFDNEGGILMKELIEHESVELSVPLLVIHRSHHMSTWRFILLLLLDSLFFWLRLGFNWSLIFIGLWANLVEPHLAALWNPHFHFSFSLYLILADPMLLEILMDSSRRDRMPFLLILFLGLLIGNYFTLHIPGFYLDLWFIRIHWRSSWLILKPMILEILMPRPR